MQLNRWTGFGRLTRPPVVAVLAGGRKMTSFGLAFVGSRRYDQASREWVEEECVIDCKAFDPEGGKGRMVASSCERLLKLGTSVYVEGRLILDKWKAQDSTPRQAIRLLVESVQVVAQPDQEAADAYRKKLNDKLLRQDESGGRADSIDIPF